MTISQSVSNFFAGLLLTSRGSRGVVSTVSISGAFLLALAVLFFAGSLLDEIVERQSYCGCYLYYYCFSVLDLQLGSLPLFVSQLC